MTESDTNTDGDGHYVSPIGAITQLVLADAYVVVQTERSVQTYDRSDIKVDELLERLPDDVPVVEDGDAV